MVSRTRSQNIDRSAERERFLIVAAQAGDSKAAADLISMHEGFIVQCVSKCRIPASAEWDDLWQVATMALLTALRSFDVTREVRFLTYAGYAIQQQLWRFVSRENSRDPMASLDVSPCGRTDLTMAALVPDERDNFNAERRELIFRIRDCLDQVREEDERTRDILRRRLRGEKLTDIGKSYSISKERVRQLESKAILKVTEFLTGAAS